MKQGPPLWLRVVALSGDEGRRWTEEYRRASPVTQPSADAVAVLLKRRFEEGWRLLEQARENLERLEDGADPSVRLVAERWYNGALGYYHYAREAYDEADCTMARAQRDVAAAIGRRRWLIPVALDCYEIAVHRVRIARERQDWETMRERARSAEAMRTGREPFCTLPDGTAVALTDVRAFYASVAEAPPEVREDMDRTVDEAESAVEAGRSTRMVERLSGFVIQYP